MSRLVENLPLVLEGVRVYLGAVPSSQQSGKGANEGFGEKEGEAENWVLDESVTSMDLLQVDLTDESALRQKIYKRLEVKDNNLLAERSSVINDIDQRNIPPSKENRISQGEVESGERHLVETK